MTDHKDRNCLLTPRKLRNYVGCGVTGIILVAVTFHFVRLNRQEYRVWVATANWFSAQSMRAPIVDSTSLPAEDEEVRVPGPYGCSDRWSLDAETVAAFYEKNIRQRHIFFSDKMLDQDTKKPDDYTFFDRLAEWMLQEDTANEQSVKKLIFSRVGFGNEDTVALVYAEYLCPLCGYGAYFFLEKQGSEWEITDVCERWVS